MQIHIISIYTCCGWRVVFTARVGLVRPIKRLPRFLRQEMVVLRTRMVAFEMRKVYGLERSLGCRTSRTS